MTTMTKEAFMIAIIDYRTNDLKEEIRKRIGDSELTKEEAILLVDKACDDIVDAICRLYDVSED